MLKCLGLSVTAFGPSGSTRFNSSHAETLSGYYSAHLLASTLSPKGDESASNYLK